jgi:hypothetical protein
VNPFPYYDAGYEAGLHGDDACPHLVFTFAWFWWQAGNAVGHHVMCSQLEFLATHYPQD